MRVLGRGVYTFSPCIPFTKDDDPAQHRLAACIFEGNCNFGCINCLFPTNQGALYDPAIHVLRNSERLKLCTSKGEQFNDNEITSVASRAVFDEFKSQSVHPIINAFSEAPMGVGNSIYNIPHDLLHTWLSDII